MNKAILPIILLAFILMFSVGIAPTFASEHDDSSNNEDDDRYENNRNDDRYDDDDRDDDRYDDDDRDDDKYESKADYQEERKEYRDSKVCVNEEECVHDDDFKEAREKYREERQSLRDSFHGEKQFSDSNKRYFEMLQILRKANLGDDYVLPPRFQMSIIDTPQDLQCREGLELIFKQSNDRPACIKPNTAEKMIERGIAYRS